MALAEHSARKAAADALSPQELREGISLKFLSQ
jgi:hypothetical protein